MIKILHLSTSKFYGGAEEHIRLLGKYIDKNNFSIEVLCPDGDFKSILEENSIYYNLVEIPSKFSIQAYLKIRKIIHQKNIDILHTHNRRGDFIGLISTKFLNKNNILLVTTVHDRIDVDEKGNKLKFLSRFLHSLILRKYFAKIICVSDATRRQVIKNFNISENKVIHIINAIDFQRIRIKRDIFNIKKEIGVDEEIKIVGLIARVRGKNFEKKGHRYFISAAKEIVKKYDNVRFLIAGEDETARNILKEIISGYGLERYFLFIGYIKNIAEIISCIDILVLPSIYEGKPRIVMEAMYLQKPVVASNVDGIPEVIEDGKTGFLVKPKDVNTLSEKILSLLNDTNLQRSIGDVGKQKIEKEYRVEFLIKMTEDLYENLIKNKNVYSTGNY